jgi:two-component system NtrC family sensor kinase
MRLHLNLQWKVLLLVAGMMSAILFSSFYLHRLITRELIEEDRYHSAVSKTVALAGRIAEHDLFTEPEKLRQDVQYVTISNPDVKQVDVYYSAREGLRLAASTAPAAARLPVLDEAAQDNELGEMERPLPDVVTEETLNDGLRYWIICAAIKDRDGDGFVTALIRKNPKNILVSNLQRQHNLVLGSALVASVLLLYLVFVYFFRRPARDIVNAMAQAQAGDLDARSVVRREDELGEIARGFNRMLQELGERDREREKLLTQISDFNNELRDQVKAATHELRTTNESLLQTQQRLARYERLAAIGQVAASLAHEIGTPLNAIAGHLQLLGDSFPHDLNTQRRVGIINKQLDFIVGIVRTLLQRTHKRRAVLKPTDLNALLRELVLLVKPTLDEHAITLNMALASESLTAHIDPDSLQQVFLNLINNSIDAMPEGGHLEITSRMNESADSIELVFRDDGKGIPADALEHLFEPLWKTKDACSGFGLAIAREIMLEHSGKIEALKDQTAGAAFMLTLTLSAAASSATNATATEVEVLTGVT